ncbi:MAG: DNA cytosine methyltransferase [Planctomycetaceae bacterium]|nr:DNA cytosine methyltransferase [Planctomycetaceae bacterium]
MIVLIDPQSQSPWFCWNGCSVKNTTTPPSVIDLFCGAGGLSLGFVRAGFQPQAAFDHWQPAVETYRANLGDHVQRVAITRDLDISCPTVIAGGPPCQGFSSAGSRRRHLLRVPRRDAQGPAEVRADKPERPQDRCRRIPESLLRSCAEHHLVSRCGNFCRGGTPNRSNPHLGTTPWLSQLAVSNAYRV